MWDDYTWIVVLGAFMAFFTAYGIGANDVANAFASSVGSKALTLKQAVIIAGIFEFGGAVLLGSEVTDTVRKKIADREAFEDDPELLMYGMLSVLAATGIWLLLASFLELPVSTTHSVIGGIIGMSLTAKGSDAVVWYEFDDDADFLKKFKGVVPVIASWVISPVLSGVFAVILFWGTRTFVLRHANSLDRTIIFFPILVGITIAINLYFIIYKGFSRKVKWPGEDEKVKLSEHLGDGFASLIAWGVGLGVGVILYFVAGPWLKKQGIAAGERAEALGSVKNTEKEGLEKPEAAEEEHHSALDKIEGLNHDVHKVIKEDNTVGSIHDSAEKFAIETEEVFKYLQVFTAMCDSFAHGANDVANSIGPFAAIYGIYRKEELEKKVATPEWILALGGFGIVVGLGTYGYNIIRAIGVKLTKITPSRGYAIELGSATTIVLGSVYGIPLSTTHCQVGATVGVGLLEGGKGVNGLLFLKVISGWILTLIVVGFTAAAFFAQAAYAPSIPNLDAINRYQDGIFDTTEAAWEALKKGNPDLNETNHELAGKFVDVSEGQVQLLSDTVADLIEQCGA